MCFCLKNRTFIILSVILRPLFWSHPRKLEIVDNWILRKSCTMWLFCRQCVFSYNNKIQKRHFFYRCLANFECPIWEIVYLCSIFFNLELKTFILFFLSSFVLIRDYNSRDHKCFSGFKSRTISSSINPWFWYWKKYYYYVALFTIMSPLVLNFKTFVTRHGIRTIDRRYFNCHQWFIWPVTKRKWPEMRRKWSKTYRNWPKVYL